MFETDSKHNCVFDHCNAGANRDFPWDQMGRPGNLAVRLLCGPRI